MLASTLINLYKLCGGECIIIHCHHDSLFGPQTGAPLDMHLYANVSYTVLINSVRLIHNTELGWLKLY